MMYRRPIKAFADTFQKCDVNSVMTRGGIIALRDGLPLVEDGKMSGVIEGSGAGSPDEATRLAAAALTNTE